MKFLRNPIVTGLLTVAAVAVLLYQVMGGAFNKFHAGGITKRLAKELAAIPGVIVESPPPVADTRPPETAEPVPDANIDRGYLEARFARWVAAPARDPFLLFADPKERLKEEEEFASPISKWKLNGIWDQTGGKLAIINKTVHRVGDEIEGYRILRIEGDEVWFQGPKRKERLGLAHHGPAVVPNPVFQPAPEAGPPVAVPQ
jgi:hypothetical protein